MSLVPLYDLTQQFNNKNGAVLVGGRLYVYYVGRTELATTWADEDAAAQNTNPVLLDNNGRAPVFVDDSYSYTLVVCDRAGTELFSQDITPGGAGSVGGRIVYHDDTLSGAGTVSSLLGVVNIPLGVDETMTAYTGVAEGKDALILGVNGDWFNETFSGEFDKKVDLETFSACCSSVKEGLDNKLDASAINNYYTKNEVDGRTSSFVNYNFLSGNYYNKFETSSREELYSAFLSAGQGGGEGSCPWITGGKEITNTQTLTGDMIVQVLSSFTLSGDHNHFISVKGGVYRFPNRYEIASSIAETNYFMPQSGMSSYLPMSSFSSYTAYIQNNLTDNWNYTNSAYSLSINNFHNKLDVSAFSAWSAVQEPVLIGDSNVTAISSKVDSHIQWNLSVNSTPVVTDTRLIGDNCVTAHTTETSGEWIVGLVQSAYEAINSVGGIATDVDTLKNASGNYYPMTGNPSGFLTSHQIIPSSKWEDASDTVQTNSAQWAENTGDTAVNLYVYNNSGINNEVNNVVTANSAYWNTVTGKLDYSAFTAYTANDETYTLIGGKDIGISSDDVNKETTIYFTGSNGDEEVNNLVHSNSSYWSNGGESYTALTLNSATWNDITVYQSHSGDYITAHQVIPSSKWEDASDVVQSNSAQWGNGGDSYNVLTSNSALWNAVYDLVATYSAKWLINGDV